MQILSPERYIILNRDEINSYDEYNLDFLRDMSREDILKKVPHLPKGSVVILQTTFYITR
jgi:hypothetical protein